MTLHGFREDAELKALRRIGKNPWPRRIFKIVLVLAGLFFVGLIVLSKIGGNSEPLRKSVEEFFHGNTRYEARLQTLNNMQFFPATIVDFEGLSLYDPDQADEPAITVGKAHMEAGFWDIALTKGSIRFIALESITFKEGTIFPAPVTLDFLKISDVSATESRLVSEGRIGKHPYSFSINVDASGEGYKRRYKLSDQRALEINLGDIKFTGTLVFDRHQHAKIENLTILQDKKAILEGSLDINFGESSSLLGGLTVQPHGTKLEPDLHFQNGKVTGTVRAADYHAGDFARGGPFDRLLTDLAVILGYESFFENADIILEMSGHKGKLPVKNGHIDVTALPESAP